MMLPIQDFTADVNATALRGIALNHNTHFHDRMLVGCRRAWLEEKLDQKKLWLDSVSLLRFGGKLYRNKQAREIFSEQHDGTSYCQVWKQFLWLFGGLKRTCMQ